MSRRHLVMLLGLAAIWGSSFMFIKIAVRDIPPSTAVLGRIGIGMLVLALVAPLVTPIRGSLSSLRSHWFPVVVVGVLNTALPIYLLFWAETRIASGTAALLQATAPLFTALFAFFFVHSERVSGQRLVGLFVGFAGVAVLVGTLEGGSMLGGLAVVGSALCYSAAGLYAGKRLAHLPTLFVALSTLTVATLVLLPAGLAELPSEMPGWKSIASVVILGTLGTAFAYLLFYDILAGAGASRAILITYLVPPTALLYGTVFLDEALSVSSLAGLALILGGVALGTGAVALRQRPEVAPSKVTE
jgi:drug/metabolite transporter (DMT)-like permease